MAGLLQRAMRLVRPSETSITKTLIPRNTPIAHLHQHGPSRSAVVHEQALPRSQTQAEEPPSFLSTSQSRQPGSSSTSTRNDTANLDTIISHIPPRPVPPQKPANLQRNTPTPHHSLRTQTAPPRGRQSLRPREAHTSTVYVDIFPQKQQQFQFQAQFRKWEHPPRQQRHLGLPHQPRSLRTPRFRARRSIVRAI